MNTPKRTRKEPDASLIQSLGGPSKLAAELGLSPYRGPQRVSNWQFRGIPPEIKIERPDLFLPHLTKRRKPAKEGA